MLVHGAFADASSWNGVIKRLQAQGVPVTAPANPLRGVYPFELCQGRSNFVHPETLFGRNVAQRLAMMTSRVMAGSCSRDEELRAALHPRLTSVPKE